MKSKLRVGLVCGGCSLEHEVSLKSAIYIMKYINKRFFEVVVLWISKQGDWYIVENDDMHIDFFVNKENLHKCMPILMFSSGNRCFEYINNILSLDVIFPIIHGALGEDGSLQGLLRLMNLPYVGSDVLGSAICMDKDITKRLLRDSGLSITPFRTFLAHEKKKLKFLNFADMFGLPFFVKPVNQGSSIGVAKVNDDYSFHSALDIAFFYSHKIIIESCIAGRELECAVLGNNENPITSVCGEIIKKNDDFYTYCDKYVDHNSEIVIPAVLEKSVSSKIRSIAIRVFQILNCFGMARVDIFLFGKDRIIINEVNTLPGFTSDSMYLKLWQATGINISTLLTRLIMLALDRYYKYN
ncbi:D-alanine:D-alanine ligase A [Candidatus Blochmanniella floridana]|uniref:D-alanine--D-alanine ligase n=1 Tax=Blochmanniella floridana TaxID=203907 RepID=DDL_BLOFL|nr:RecName: Full=D-alanine--D-alanine ligase; AltName: Full=D-Ala-D-Ala ligase; AltName: Full=D-alanylalanine synthetase [Candidatus Blochmannia floridanus]CAD83163.1 D-alanine:D-alanine ligase A [Candidatus Blochmannia floridanus]